MCKLFKNIEKDWNDSERNDSEMFFYLNLP